MTPQPTQTHRVTVWLIKEDGTEIQSYTTETRQWWDAVLDIMGWLRIEVLPYWTPGSLALVWSEDGMDLRLSGALYGMAASHRLQPAWLPRAPEAWEPCPDLRRNAFTAFSRPECPFNYCSYPDACKERCQHGRPE